MMGSARAMMLGAALVLGGVSMVVTAPLHAQKKEKAAKQNGPKLSAGFRANAVEVQKLMDAKDFAAAKTKIDSSVASAVDPEDKFYLGNFQLQTGLALKDEALQRVGVETIIGSGATPAADLPRYHFFAGQFALNAKDIDAAITHLKAAATGGYGGANTNVLIAESYFTKAQNNVNGSQLNPTGKQIALEGLPFLKQAISSEKAAGNPISKTWFSRGFTMAVLSGSPDLMDWTRMAIESAPTVENWRIALRSFQDRNPGMQRDENVDLLRLMVQTNSLAGDYSYAELIDASQKSGILGEVKAVIDQGRASGKLPANKFADVYSIVAAGIPADKAALPRSETTAANAATGRVAAATANAYLGYGEHAKAAELYRMALKKGGVDADEVNSRLGIALTRLGDIEGAKAAFAAVSSTSQARRMIADLWTLYLGTRSAA